MAELKPEPTITYADGYPYWMNDGHREYGLVPRLYVETARELSAEFEAVFDEEAATGDLDEDRLHDAEDRARGLVHALAELFPS